MRSAATPGIAGRPVEPPGLVEHLAHCAHARGRWHAARGLVEATHSALLPRFVSTVSALAALMMGVAWLAG